MARGLSSVHAISTCSVCWTCLCAACFVCHDCAKPTKCQFGMRQCVYLGHVVGGGQVHPEPSKLTAVENFPTPTTKKQVCAFLGLTGYYRRFMADYANLAAPLTDLTRKTAANTVVWTPKCEHSFQELKRFLCAACFTQPRFFIAFYPTNRRV